MWPSGLMSARQGLYHIPKRLKKYILRQILTNLQWLALNSLHFHIDLSFLSGWDSGLCHQNQLFFSFPCFNIQLCIFLSCANFDPLLSWCFYFSSYARTIRNLFQHVKHFYKLQKELSAFLTTDFILVLILHVCINNFTTADRTKHT